MTHSTIRVGHSKKDSSKSASSSSLSLQAGDGAFEDYFKSARVGLYRSRLDTGKIIDCNDQLAHLFGYSNREECIAEYAREKHYLDPEMLKKLYATLGSRRKIADFEAKIVRKDGKERWLSFWCHIDRKKNFIDGAAVDVTLNKDATRRITAEVAERMHAQEALSEAKAAAEAANVAKSGFLANMSHELRTPMNAILGMTELALEESTSDTQRDYLRIALESGHSLLRILDDLLDFSRVEAGKMSLDEASFSLRSAVDKSLKPFVTQVEQKRLSLICDIDETIPDLLSGDFPRFRQVITNLVGNAIKFTSQGRITVQCKLKKQEDHRVLLECSVSDTGIGISAENLDKIFSPFIQGDPSTSRSFGGTGLGLAICDKLVSLMGGRISVKSQLGVGSTFTFTVPFSVPDHFKNEGLSLSKTDALEGVRALVVDDDFVHRNKLEQRLLQWGMHVDSVSNIGDALKRLQKALRMDSKPSVVLVSDSLEGLDGFILARWVCNVPSLKSKVILMVSPQDRRDLTAKCFELGAYLLQKPISQVELQNTLLKALQSRVDAEANNNSLRSELTEKPLNVLLVEDTAANQLLVERLLSRRGHQVVIAGSGNKALERVKERPFDVILMDVQMPGIDGYETTRLIRTLPDPSVASTPIVAMTAHAMQSDEQRCRECGMNAYVSKPFNLNDLVQQVERIAAEFSRAC